MNRIRFATSLSAIFATLALAGTASAEDGFNVNRFDPSERGSDWFSTESLDLRGAHRFALGAVTEYNHDPLEVRHTDGGTVTEIVSDQLVMHLGGNIVLVDRLRLGVDLPIAAYANGNDATANNQSYAQPTTTAIGDLRVAADVRLFGEYGDKFTMAAGVQVFLPTGSQSAYTSDGNVRFTPRLLGAGKYGMFEYGARVGFAFRQIDDHVDSIAIGSEFTFGGSAGVRVLHDRLLIGPELFGGVGTVGGARNNGMEILGGAHGKVTDSIRASLGVGGGLTSGFGTPSFRTMLSLEWAPSFEKAGAPPPPPKDEAPPVYPDPPKAPEIVSIPTPVWPIPPEAPKDRDGDGIADADDACPDDAGPKNADPARNGCPIARLSNSRIEIMDQVKFRTASAEIDPASDPILDAVLKIMLAHPELAKLRVDGHTDNKGNKDNNQKLSASRAAAVAKWLQKHGVEAPRLASKGFGQTQPIASNDTEDGRRDNRRVEFHVEEAAHASR